MQIGLIYRTISNLKLLQVLFQIKKRLIKPFYKSLGAPKFKRVEFKTVPISKPQSLDGIKFNFLNLDHQFDGWNYLGNGKLWVYNLNYFDWINQDNISPEKSLQWIDRFITDLSKSFIGLDSYPIALRSINWVKFFCKYPESATKERLDSLYSQIKLLEKTLEYHLLGNHLLEDSYALYIVGSYFNDKELLKKAKKLLLTELKEQILPDGAHYEQSPMYHCILLDRLLDCININACSELERYARLMLGHLESIIWNDGSIPLLNDSANGIAPTTSLLFNYAKRLDLKWKQIPMKECGYRKMSAGEFEAIVDVGNITSTYQPGHTHADSLNYELHVEGRPFVVDCGISTYNKTERRQYERNTAAHNCVVAEGKNSSEVWGGFRVGKSCNTDITEDTNQIVEAVHDGFAKPCKRRFEVNVNEFIVEDWYDGEAVSYIHVAEGADYERIKIYGTGFNVEIGPWKYSTEYNRFKEGKEIKITFKNYLKYTIQ